MKPGRRIADPSAKQLAGTFRKDRHANIVEIAAPPRSTLTRPSYMTAEGRAVWDEELPRVTACGATEADSSLFARYCECEAAFRVQVMAGELPKASLLTELRRMAELLAIGGQRSRLARTADAGPTKRTFTPMPK